MIPYRFQVYTWGRAKTQKELKVTVTLMKTV